jgi:CIC family chloride channel protein
MIRAQSRWPVFEVLKKWVLQGYRTAASLRTDEGTFLVVSSVVVGLLGGAANILFRSSMQFVHNHIFVGGSNLLHITDGGWHRLLLPLLPMAGALLLIPLSLLFPGEVNGYGFAKFLEAVNIKGGFLKLRNILLKTVAPALTIGSGGSAGVEGPIAIIGGTVGSSVGRLLKTSSSRTKLLIAAGSAAGIAATFNAPIAGVMFSTEIVLLGDYEIASFAAIIIASGVATVVSRGYYGANPAFPVPLYELRSIFELPLYLILGLIVGFTAVFYIRTFYRMKDEFDALKLHAQLKPVLGAFVVGCLGIFLPQIMGNGYEFIEGALQEKIIFPVLVLLVLIKIVATSITLGSGGAGGVFAPALFIGAMTGGSFGMVVHYLFPHATATPGAYATVGIGAFLAATTHAPLTGIFLLFEMTGNYKIIVPLMLCAIIGTFVSRRMYRDSIDTADLTRKGIRLHAGKERSIMGRIKVADVMRPDVVTVSRETPLHVLIQLMIDEARFYIPVLDAMGGMVGIVSIHDVRPVLLEEKVTHIVNAGDIATENVIVLAPDDDLNAAMEKFSIKDLEEIPVVEHKGSNKVIGMVRRKDMFEVYNREVLRKESGME